MLIKVHDSLVFQASDDTLRQLVMAYEKSLLPDHTQRKAGSCRTLVALHLKTQIFW